MFYLGFFGSHNATLAISYGSKVLEAVEVERFLSHKNAALFYYEKPSCAEDIIREINNYFIQKYNVDTYDKIIINSVPSLKYGYHEQKLLNFDDIFEYNELKYMLHHDAHCYSGLYQSPYDEALVISFDGGSDQKFFNVFYAKKGFPCRKIYSGKKDYAISYMTPAHFIKDIKRENNTDKDKKYLLTNQYTRKESDRLNPGQDSLFTTFNNLVVAGALKRAFDLDLD